MRDIPHLRIRTNYVFALFRVTVDRFRSHPRLPAVKRFFNITPPLITGNDAEGGGEVFTWTTRTDGDCSNDFFGKRACLYRFRTASRRAFCLGYDKVIPSGPTFRAENSNPTRMQARFWMVEPEMAFCDLEAGHVRHGRPISGIVSKRFWKKPLMKWGSSTNS